MGGGLESQKSPGRGKSGIWRDQGWEAWAISLQGWVGKDWVQPSSDGCLGALPSLAPLRGV